MQVKQSMFKNMQKILHKLFPNMSDQDVDDIIGQDITYIPPMYAENIPSKKEYIKH